MQIKSLFLYGIVILLGGLFFSMNAIAQNPFTKKISVELHQLSKAEALRKVAEITEIPILFSDDFFTQNDSVNIAYQNKTITFIIADLLKENQLTITNKTQPALIILSRAFYTVYGYVKDLKSNTPLPYSNILINNYEVVGADKNGHFFAKLKAGKNALQCSFITFKDTIIHLNVQKDTPLNLYLSPNNQLQEVIISDYNNPSSNPIEELRDINKYGSKELMAYAVKTPGITGSDDIFHAAKSLPGVQSGAGGIGGHFVRGGSQGQNQYLLDDVPIYNPFHALGLVSTITPAMAKSLQVHKIGYSAAYGDFTSSVFDIQLKDGNANKLEGGANINLNDVALNIGMPIVKGKSALFLYGRTAISGINLDNILKNALFPDTPINFKKHYYDVIAKAYTAIGKKHKLSFSFYKGHDLILGDGAYTYNYEYEEEDEEEEEVIIQDEDLEVEIDAEVAWGNQLFLLNWESTLKPNLFFKAAVSANRYLALASTFQETEIETLGVEEEKFRFDFTESQNNDYEAKLQLNYLAKKWWRLKLGGGYLRQLYHPTNNSFTDETIILEEDYDDDEINVDFLETFSKAPRQTTQKIYLYGESHFNFRNWVLNLGLRNSYFHNISNSYQQFNMQPRFSVDYRLKEKHFLSFNYTSSVQYNHLISNTEISLPQDFWYPSTNNLTPQIGHQFDVGYTIYKKRNHSLRSNIYYKTIHRIARINSQNENILIDDNAIIGKATAYGLELAYNIFTPKYGLQLSYALSKSTHQFEEQNLGKAYPFQFDRRHELKTLFYYNLPKNFSIGSSLYLGSGHPILYAFNFDLQQGIQQDNRFTPGKKNQDRSNIHYRLDLSLSYQQQIKNTHHTVKLNLFNTLNTQLPLYYTLEEEEDEEENETEENEFSPKFNLRFIPSVAYTIEF